MIYTFNYRFRESQIVISRNALLNFIRRSAERNLFSILGDGRDNLLLGQSWKGVMTGVINRDASLSQIFSFGNRPQYSPEADVTANWGWTASAVVLRNHAIPPIANISSSYRSNNFAKFIVGFWIS